MAWLTPSQARRLSEDERVDYLVRTVLGEAVSEGPTGMLVVAQVIANRTGDARWPADPVAVAGQAYQFSTNAPTARGGGNQGMVDQYGPDTPEYKQAERIVRAAVFERTVPDIIGGAKHYHTKEMGWPSTWPSNIKKNGHLDIGAHRVYPEHPVPPGSIPNAASTLAFLDAPDTALGAANAMASKPFEIKDVSNALAFNFGEMNNPNALVVHHTGGSGTNRPNVNGVIQTFKDRNFPAHFIIDRDGTVYRALPETAKGQHTRPSERADIRDITNDNSWGVEIIALDDTDVLPAQTEAAVALAQYLSKGYGMPTERVVGHGYINGHKQSTEGQSTVIAMRQSGLAVASYAANLQPTTAVGSELAIVDPFTAAKTRTMPAVSVTMPTPTSERALARAGSTPSEMPHDLRLQREVNRVAAQKRNAIFSEIRKSRVLAFNNVDPFEAGPSGASIATKPQRATGTIGTDARAFALMTTPVGVDAPGLTLTRTTIKPPVRQSTPWTADQMATAARAASADAAAGRGQMVMTGNPNIAGSVVDWLYPVVREGLGEANQEGKGPRAKVDPVTASIARGQEAATPDMAAVAEKAARESRGDPGQSTIERNPPSASAAQSGIGQPPRTIVRQSVPVKKPGQSVIERNPPKPEPAPAKAKPGQSIIERDPPRVVVTNGKAAVIPQSQIERAAPATIFRDTAQEIAQKKRTPVETALAAEIAARRLREASAPVSVMETQERLPAGLPYSKTTQRALDPEQFGPPMPLGAVPNNLKVTPPQSHIERNPPKKATPVAPSMPVDIRERELARGNPLFGQPGGATIKPQTVIPSAWPTDASLRPRTVTLSAWPTDLSGRPTASPRTGPTPVPRPANTNKAPAAKAQPAASGGGGGGGSSSSGASAAPRFVSAVDGAPLVARETKVYNPDTNQFEARTLYERVK